MLCAAVGSYAPLHSTLVTHCRTALVLAFHAWCSTNLSYALHSCDAFSFSRGFGTMINLPKPLPNCTRHQQLLQALFYLLHTSPSCQYLSPLARYNKPIYFSGVVALIIQIQNAHPPIFNCSRKIMVAWRFALCSSRLLRSIAFHVSHPLPHRTCTSISCLVLHKPFLCPP